MFQYLVIWLLQLLYSLWWANFVLPLCNTNATQTHQWQWLKHHTDAQMSNLVIHYWYIMYRSWYFMVMFANCLFCVHDEKWHCKLMVFYHMTGLSHYCGLSHDCIQPAEGYFKIASIVFGNCLICLQQMTNLKYPVVCLFCSYCNFRILLPVN